MNNELELLQRINKLEREINDLKRIEIPTIPTWEYVGARYTTDAGQSINSASWTTVNFEDEGYDTHDAVTIGSTWKFTAPITGYYHFAVKLGFSSSTAWAEIEQMIAYGLVNGYDVIEFGRRLGMDGSGGAVTASISGGTTYLLTANDYFRVRVYQNSGSALTLATTALLNYVTIDRVG